MSKSYAPFIDHTLLKPDATRAQIIQLCQEAKQYQFASVCINPAWVETAASELAGSTVKVCTVIGFPLGASTPAAKAFEAKDAIANGAAEVDMVINIGALKDGNDQLVERDIRAVITAAKPSVLVKVIIETCLLTQDEKERVCNICKTAGADFVKTSTGFSTGGATVEDVTLMHTIAGETMEVKASGGVRSLKDAQTMIAAGATRIGTSAGVAIVTGAQSSASY